MKTKLLRKLRKRFDWKFVIHNDKKTLFLYDKKWNWIRRNTGVFAELMPTDLEYLLEEYENKKIKDKYGRKKMKIKFNKL